MKYGAGTAEAPRFYALRVGRGKGGGACMKDIRVRFEPDSTLRHIEVAARASPAAYVRAFMRKP